MSSGMLEAAVDEEAEVTVVSASPPQRDEGRDRSREPSRDPAHRQPRRRDTEWTMIRLQGPPSDELERADEPADARPKTTFKEPVKPPAQKSQAPKGAPAEEEPLSFDPESEVYMANACCELLHYRVALYVVGAAEILLLGAWAALNYLWYSKVGLGVVGGVSLGVQALFAVAALVCIALMCYGCWAERPNFIWPHMIYQMLGIGVGIGLTVAAVVAMAAGTSVADAVFGALFGRANLPEVERRLGPIWPFCLAVIFDFGAAIGIWFYILVRGAYDFLLDKAFFADYSRRKRRPNAGPTTAAPPTSLSPDHLQETAA